jgi:BirA family biotin operon repressor/biotin-[acetyl-CoA-carboxylase] ligase
MIGSNIIRKKEVPSTNTLAMELLKKQSLPEGTVIRCDNQTAGRGQRGNSWESEGGKNLTFTAIVYPHFLKVEDQFMISKVTSLAITDFLSQYMEDVKIKWPNDIYVKDDKIAGILIENSIINASFDYMIIGIGLNINQDRFPGDIPNPTSLKIRTGRDFDLDDTFQVLCGLIDNRYKQLIDFKIDTLNSEYLSRLFRYNAFHKYQHDKKVFSAKITGLDPFGAIVLETEEGEVRTYGFTEIEYIL